MIKRAGGSKIYVDGSFVTGKKIPGDWDGCYCNCEIDQSLLDPIILEYNRIKIKNKYMCDIFADDCIETSSGVLFVDFFQEIRGDSMKKGIILLDVESVK